MPPAPPTVGPDYNSYGSAWGLSGDGCTLTGLYLELRAARRLGPRQHLEQGTGTFTELPTPSGHNPAVKTLN